MVAKRIDVDPDSDLAQLLHQAKEQPVLLDLDGNRSRLRLEGPAEGRNHPDDDPDNVLNAMEEAQGAITPEQAEEWIQNIYRWRREGSRSANEP